MRTALVVVASGELYWGYVRDMLVSAKTYFVKHDVFLWTDCFSEPLPFHRRLLCQYQGHPGSTLYRYHMILQAKEELEQYDQIFYADADMRFVAPVGDIFSDGITATLHPGYMLHVDESPFERRPESAAYLHSIRNYFCGGFNGGNAKAYLAMAEKLKKCIDVDLRNEVMAVWHDESHLNRYLYDNPPAKILTPSYCFPETMGSGGYCGWTADQHPAILVALNKTINIPEHRRQQILAHRKKYIQGYQ